MERLETKQVRRRRQRSLGPGWRPQRDHPRGQGFRLPGGKTRGCGKERLNASDTPVIASHGDPSRAAERACLTDGATQALGGLRDNDQVNMIGHQAIYPDRDLLCAAE
jgi:hypothetical protein